MAVKSMIYSNKGYSVFGNMCKQADGDNHNFSSIDITGHSSGSPRHLPTEVYHASFFLVLLTFIDSRTNTTISALSKSGSNVLPLYVLPRQQVLHRLRRESARQQVSHPNPREDKDAVGHQFLHVSNVVKIKYRVLENHPQVFWIDRQLRLW